MAIAAITASVPMALGIALSPLPIAAIVMMLMTKRAKANAPSFLLGWITYVSSWEYCCSLWRYANGAAVPALMTRSKYRVSSLV